MEAANRKQFLFLNSNFIDALQLLFALALCSTSAALLGGVFGFSLIKITNKMNGTVTIIAYTFKNKSKSSTVLLESSISPGNPKLAAIETKVASTDPKVATVMTSDLNQFIVILLALFIKISPLPPHRNDPNRHKQAPSAERVVLSQIPTIIRTAAMQQLILMPFLVSIQLTGKASIACEMGQMRQLRVTKIEGIPYIFQTIVVVAENVLTGNELTNDARMYVEKMINLYGLSLYIYSGGCCQLLGYSFRGSCILLQGGSTIYLSNLSTIIIVSILIEDTH